MVGGLGGSPVNPGPSRKISYSRKASSWGETPKGLLGLVRQAVEQVIGDAFPAPVSHPQPLGMRPARCRRLPRWPGRAPARRGGPIPAGPRAGAGGTSWPVEGDAVRASPRSSADGWVCQSRRCHSRPTTQSIRSSRSTSPRPVPKPGRRSLGSRRRRVFLRTWSASSPDRRPGRPGQARDRRSRWYRTLMSWTSGKPQAIDRSAQRHSVSAHSRLEFVARPSMNNCRGHAPPTMAPGSHGRSGSLAWQRLRR